MANAPEPPGILEVQDDARVRLITFNRPDALNAFNDDLYRAAGNALRDAAERSDVACVVLTGAGRAFSAGQDLAEMSQIDTSRRDDAGARQDAAAAHGFPVFLDTLAAFEKPVIAAVNGLGVGIGMTMLFHCDVVYISETARLRAPFVPLGVVPEAAGSLLMPTLMGAQRAAISLYTGEWLSATDAVECGLALEVVAPDALIDRALHLARRIAKMPVTSLVESKRLVIAGRIDAIRAARAREDEAFTRMVGAPANLEAITAFLEKRDPDFTGL
jgi:enoyl-CoA hydratase/carnithine racemase